MTDSDIKFDLNSEGYGYSFNGNGRVLIVSDEQDEDLLYEAKDAIEQIYDDLWEDEDGDWEEDPEPVFEHNGIQIQQFDPIEEQIEDGEITINDVIAVVEGIGVHVVFCESNKDGTKKIVRDVEDKNQIREILENKSLNLKFLQCEFSYE